MRTVLTVEVSYLPHEIGEIAGRDVALASSVEALEGRIGLIGLCLAEVLAAKLNSLLALTRVGEQLGQLFLRANRHVLRLHHLSPRLI